MKRLEFTRPTKREAWDRSDGECECHRVPDLKRPFGCGVRLNINSGIYYEHIIQDAIKSDNSINNCAVLCRTCWREKTSIDIPTIARSNRIRDWARGIR